MAPTNPINTPVHRRTPTTSRRMTADSMVTNTGVTLIMAAESANGNIVNPVKYKSDATNRNAERLSCTGRCFVRIVWTVLVRKIKTMMAR